MLTIIGQAASIGPLHRPRWKSWRDHPQADASAPRALRGATLATARRLDRHTGFATRSQEAAPSRRPTWNQVGYRATWLAPSFSRAYRIVSRRLKPASDRRMNSGRLHGASRPTGLLAALPRKEACHGACIEDGDYRGIYSLRAAGLSCREIAKCLGIQRETVSRHLRLQYRAGFEAPTGASMAGRASTAAPK